MLGNRITDESPIKWIMTDDKIEEREKEYINHCCNETRNKGKLKGK
jgi:hypothetical protein